MRTERISREMCYMNMALILAERSTCRRRAVGCILVNKRGRVLGLGYNGSPTGRPHCIDKPCPGADFKSGDGLNECEAIHAEINALAHCQNMFTIHSIYVTTSPCIHCIKPLMNTSAENLYFIEEYPHERVKQLWLNDSKRKWIKLL